MAVYLLIFHHFPPPQIAEVWGTLIPDFHLSFPLPSFDLGSHVHVSNTTVTLQKSDPVVELTTDVEFEAPAINSVKARCRGAFALDQRLLDLSGRLEDNNSVSWPAILDEQGYDLSTPIDLRVWFNSHIYLFFADSS